MRKRFLEETAIFLGVLKWTFLATMIGIIVGFSTSIFLKLLKISVDFGDNYKYFYLLIPLAFFLSALMIKYLAPDAEGHGTEKVIEAIHKKDGKIKATVVPVKLVATIITLASGGSAGKEGPCAQIGAGLSSLFSDLFKFNKNDRKKLVICGVSAGFASVFGTPIAGAIFGVEVLFVGSLLYDVLLPSFIAGMISYHVSTALGITYFYHPFKFVPVFSEGFLLKVILAGIFFGICSFILIEFFKVVHKFSNKIKVWSPLKGLIGGLLLIVLVYFFSAQYLGLGLNTIESTLSGEHIVWYGFLLKIIFTSITLSFGGSGGIITPIFFIGTTAGAAFAQFLHWDIATFSAIGFVALLAGSANTPIAASIMAVEIFGPGIAPYAAIACVISYLITGYRSVYPSQILSTKKSTDIAVELGKEMKNVDANYVSGENEIIEAGLKFADDLNSTTKPKRRIKKKKRIKS